MEAADQSNLVPSSSPIIESSGEWGPEEIELGLRTLVLTGGNAAAAARRLASMEDPRPIDRRTLQHWKEDRFAHRYEQLVAEIRADLTTNVADQAMGLAEEVAEVEAELIRETRAKLKDIPAQHLARSALALAQVRSTNVQTARLLREQPTQISEIRDPAEILAELRDLKVIDAEVVEEDEPSNRA